MTSEPWCLASLLTALSTPAPSLSHPWESPSSNMTRGSISLSLKPRLIAAYTQKCISTTALNGGLNTSTTYHPDISSASSTLLCEEKGMIFLFSNPSKIHGQFFALLPNISLNSGKSVKPPVQNNQVLGPC